MTDYLYWVDVPFVMEGSTEGEGAWENVNRFSTLEEALEYVQQMWGADDHGRVSLIMPYTAGE